MKRYALQLLIALGITLVALYLPSMLSVDGSGNSLIHRYQLSHDMASLLKHACAYFILIYIGVLGLSPNKK